MQKEVVIKPVNKDLALKLEALKIVNDFSSLGFDTRGAFMAIVCHYFPKYKSKKDNLRLSNWWYSKFTDADLHSDLDIVINKLKAE